MAAAGKTYFLQSRIIPSIIACLLLFSTAAASANPSFSTKYKYFKVGGGNYEAIWSDINSKGPKSSLGIGHAGFTSFKLNNSVGIVPKNGTCQIVSIKFHLASTVQLPKWTGANNADSDIRIYWKALSSDVERHEKQHVEIAQDSVRQLVKNIKKIKPNKSCKTLKRKIRKVIKTSEKALDRAQNKFERREVRGQKKRLTKLMEQFRTN